MPKQSRKKIAAYFYRTAAGSEPVREWLLELPAADRRTIGTDIATVEFGWPVGMPVCRAITSRRGLWEVRSSITGAHSPRPVLFHEGRMILLHGFVKKTRKTPDADLDLAAKRKKEIER